MRVVFLLVAFTSYVSRTSSNTAEDSESFRMWQIQSSHRLFSAVAGGFVSRILLVLLFLGANGSLGNFRVESLAPPVSASAIHSSSSSPTRFLIVGGTGQIGKEVAHHLLLRHPTAEISLVGRNEAKGNAAVQELKKRYNTATKNNRNKAGGEEELSSQPSIAFHAVSDVWQVCPTFRQLIQQTDCLIHTAGPYADCAPSLLQAMIDTTTENEEEGQDVTTTRQHRVYVDVSDPLNFLEASLSLHDKAREKNVTALVAAGAFPGMSNVLAMEAAAAATADVGGADTQTNIQNLYFQYFTAGLGGSGAINLYITNIGFGEPMVQYSRGKLRWWKALSGLLLGKVDFGLQQGRAATQHHQLDGATTTTTTAAMQERIGQQQVFAWPFPEAATVARELNVRGNSIAAMGTAPDIWNVMLGVMVQSLVPRSWWRSEAFSQFLADFSQPLVALGDWYLKAVDPAQRGGETHGMRIDVVTGSDDGEDSNSDRSSTPTGYSIVQGHDSFRQCVGQSCAEFALDCLEHPSRTDDEPSPPAAVGGVFLPEQRYRHAAARRRIIERLTSTPGTFCYSGPVEMEDIQGPTEMRRAWKKADEDEASGRV